MTDREMLEAAARAGGYVVIRWTDDGTALLLEGVEQPWNALHETPHSDCMGDALRLAVACGISDLASAVGRLLFEESPQKDLCATVRRAIVKASAMAGLPAQQGE